MRRTTPGGLAYDLEFTSAKRRAAKGLKPWDDAPIQHEPEQSQTLAQSDDAWDFAEACCGRLNLDSMGELEGLDEKPQDSRLFDLRRDFYRRSPTFAL